MRALFVVVLMFVAVFTPVSAQAQDCVPTRLAEGQQGRVLPGTPNRYRAEPSTSASQIGEIPGGAVFVVHETGVCDGGILWARVAYDAFIGWTAEASGSDYFVEPVPPIEGALPLQQGAASLDWSSDGRFLALIDQEALSLYQSEQLSEDATILSNQPYGRAIFNPANPGMVAASISTGAFDVWTTEGGSLLQIVFQTSTNTIDGNITEVIGFNTSGDRLMVQTPTGLILYDTATWAEQRVYEGAFDTAAYSPDGRWAAIADYAPFDAELPNTQQVKLLNVETGEVVELSRDSLTSTIFTLRFSPDSTQLYAGDNRGNVQVWDVEDSTRTALMESGLPEGETLFVNDIAFAPESSEADGLLAVAVGHHLRFGEAEIRLFRDGQLQAVWRPGETLGQARAVVFAPDGERLAAIFDNQLVVASVAELLNTDLAAAAPTAVPAATVAVQIDNQCGLSSRLLVGQPAFVNSTTPNRMRSQPSTSAEQITQIFNDQNMLALEGPVCSGGFTWWRVRYKGTEGWTVEASSDAYFLEGVAVTATPTPTVTPTATPITPTLTPTPTLTLTPSVTPTPIPVSVGFADARAVTWSANSEQLAVAYQNGVAVFDREGDGWTDEPLLLALGSTWDIIPYGDSGWLAVTANAIHRIEGDNAERVMLLPSILTAPLRLTASDDGNWVLVSAAEQYALYFAPDWEMILPLDAIPRGDARLNPEGSRIAYLDVFTRDEIVIFGIDPTADSIVLDRGGLETDIMDAAFSPDGTHFAIGDDLGNIQTWDIATGTRVSAIRGEGFSASRQINRITYSADGLLIASAESIDQGIVRVYETAGMRPVGSYGVDSGTTRASDVAFSPDGKWLAALVDNVLIILETEDYTEVDRLYESVP